MNNIIKTIQKNKKILIVVLLVAAVSLGYVLKNKNADHNQNTSNITDNKNDKNSDEKKKDNKQKETTSTKDEKKPSVKEDNKSDDKKSEEVKTDVTETSTSTENTTSNNVSNNTSTTTNNTTSNSTTINPAPTPCVPTYTTVTHPAVGHYEQREIMPAYNKPIYAEKLVGGKTGRVYNTLDEFYNQDEDTNYAVQRVQVDTEYVPAEYQQVWVEDQPAYTTTEASGC